MIGYLACLAMLAFTLGCACTAVCTRLHRRHLRRRQARQIRAELAAHELPAPPPPGSGHATTEAGTPPDPASVVAPRRARIQWGGAPRHAAEVR